MVKASKQEAGTLCGHEYNFRGRSTFGCQKLKLWQDRFDGVACEYHGNLAHDGGDLGEGETVGFEEGDDGIWLDGGVKANALVRSESIFMGEAALGGEVGDSERVVVIGSGGG
ncbi:uncharacterized protein DS421_1g26090 [Arachis hypogaea]|nr:uncharacterized protein DS421_1g26090 [Arachis hypogaea]